MTNLRERVVDTIPDDVELFEQNGDVYGRDEHGEFILDPLRGSDEPVEGRCGAVCKFTMERYGQTRYCTAMPESTFVDNGSEFCRNHKSREALMERAYELFEHGYFAQNYVNFAQKLDAAKFLFAVEMVGGLFEMSTHEFELHEERRNIDTSNSNLINEDSVAVDLPLPTQKTLAFQANELWTAALKEVMTQNMQEAIFTDGMATETISQTADMEGKITDTKTESVEHHLHLPLSRVAKDIKNHLENGGVTIDDDDGAGVTFEQREYTLNVGPEDNDAEVDDVGEVASDLTEKLQSGAEEIEVETDG
jgi:hypothetical protein